MLLAYAAQNFRAGKATVPCKGVHHPRGRHDGSKTADVVDKEHRHFETDAQSLRNRREDGFEETRALLHRSGEIGHDEHKCTHHDVAKNRGPEYGPDDAARYIACGVMRLFRGMRGGVEPGNGVSHQQEAGEKRERGCLLWPRTAVHAGEVGDGNQPVYVERDWRVIEQCGDHSNGDHEDEIAREISDLAGDFDSACIEERLREGDQGNEGCLVPLGQRVRIHPDMGLIGSAFLCPIGER